MKRGLFLLFLISLLPMISRAQLNSKFQLLPLPQQIEVHNNGSYKWDAVSYITGDTIPVLGPLLDQLTQYPQKGKIGVSLNITSKNVPESEEGYILTIDRNKIEINARSVKGLFYGCATLEQVMADSKLWSINVPQMKIVDYPDIAFRAVHLDTKHHLDRMEYYYSMIDRLSACKVNAIIWELEDKLRFTRRPEVGAPNAISKQEMQALSRYAKERNIEINPLVQGLGHAGFILKHHWELRENPESDWEFCPSDERTYQIQFDLYRDALEALPDGKYLHIGGDEITEIGIDERCKQTGKTPFELQMQWLQRVCDFAIANGRTPIFWDDMPLKYADLWWVLHRGLTDEEVEKNWKTEKLDEAVALFPTNCIYMRWHYDDPTILPHLKVLDWYKNKDLKVMAATAASDGGCPFMPRMNSKAQYIKDFSSLVVDNNLVGILATAWDDGSPHLETVMRGFMAQGEYGWNPKGREVNAFKKAHAQREYGFTGNEMDFLDTLELQAFYFDGLLAEEGRRNPSWQVTDFKLIELPDNENPGEWSKKYAAKIDSAQQMLKYYETIDKGVQMAKKKARGGRYSLAIYEQNNELFNYPARLLVALNYYDTATQGKAKEEAKNEALSVCESFKTMRNNLEDVYSQTRFMKQPEGFIADQNHHHHLSALSLNSDWLYLYELPYTDLVVSWLNP